MYLKLRKCCSFGQKIVDVRGTSFQRKRLIRLTETKISPLEVHKYMYLRVMSLVINIFVQVLIWIIEFNISFNELTKIPTLEIYNVSTSITFLVVSILVRILIRTVDFDISFDGVTKISSHDEIYDVTYLVNILVRAFNSNEMSAEKERRVNPSKKIRTTDL